jgi:translocator protein
MPLDNKETVSFYKSLNKSSLHPPSWVFGVVWPLLYLGMGISTYIVWTNDKCKNWCSPLTFFFIQLFFNLIWTTLFFRMKNIFLALIDLLILVFFSLYTTMLYFQIDNLAGYLMVPYVIWLTFALYLNYYILINN